MESPSRKKAKRLTGPDRIKLETLLNERKSLREIAGKLNKSPSTISREIKNHAVYTPTKFNDCSHAKLCHRHYMCGNKECKDECNKCLKCMKTCSMYEQVLCEQRQKAPYICNGCQKYYHCGRSRLCYISKVAQREYRSNLVDVRQGFDLTLEELIHIDEVVSPLIRKGQSPYHVVNTLGNQLSISEATLRRLIDKGELGVTNIDLRDKVRRKPRKKRNLMHNEMLTLAKEGHKYNDYLEYIENNDVLIVEMDCVEGTKDDIKAILTLHFPVFHMQLAFIMEAHTSRCVINTLDMIERTLGAELFTETFQLILTDNGHEFSNIPGMEKSVLSENNRTHIFFCEPNRSDQKGSCENNHKLLRYVIPKGTSIDKYTQEDITRMVNHVNSYKRKSLCGRTPYELATQILPEAFFSKLGLHMVDAADVQLNKHLI